MSRQLRKERVNFLLSAYAGKDIRLGEKQMTEAMPSDVVIDSPNVGNPESQYDAAFPFGPSNFKWLVRFSKPIAAGQSADVVLQDSDGDQIVVFWSTSATALQIKLDENPFLQVDPTKPNWITFPRSGQSRTKITLVNPTASAVFFTLITYSGKLVINGG